MGLGVCREDVASFDCPTRSTGGFGRCQPLSELNVGVIEWTNFDPQDDGGGDG